MRKHAGFEHALAPADAPGPVGWTGLDEVCTCRDRKTSGREKNLVSLGIGARLQDTGKVIGRVEVFHEESGRMANAGCRLHPAYRGQGLTAEALQRLNTSADVRNISSNRVLEKYGFLRAGTVRQGKIISVHCGAPLCRLLNRDRAQ